jgi:flagellar basal body-associated protein FliL
MAIALAIILGLLALAFVLYPLYRRKHEVFPAQTATAVVSQEAKDANSAQKASMPPLLTEKEQSARSALQEVELDYQLGNIAQPEYQQLRERYMQQALVALKSRYVREQEIDEEIEEQLRRMKENYEKTDT